MLAIRLSPAVRPRIFPGTKLAIPPPPGGALLGLGNSILGKSGPSGSGRTFLQVKPPAFGGEQKGQLESATATITGNGRPRVVCADQEQAVFDEADQLFERVTGLCANFHFWQMPPVSESEHSTQSRQLLTPENGRVRTMLMRLSSAPSNLSWTDPERWGP